MASMVPTCCLYGPHGPAPLMVTSVSSLWSLWSLPVVPLVPSLWSPYCLPMIPSLCSLWSPPHGTNGTPPPSHSIPKPPSSPYCPFGPLPMVIMVPFIWSYGPFLWFRWFPSPLLPPWFLGHGPHDSLPMVLCYCSHALTPQGALWSTCFHPWGPMVPPHMVLMVAI